MFLIKVFLINYTECILVLPRVSYKKGPTEINSHAQAQLHTYLVYMSADKQAEQLQLPKDSSKLKIDLI